KIGRKGVWVLRVAECENFLLIGPILKLISAKNGIDIEKSLSLVKNIIVEEFRRDVIKQALLHTQYIVEKLFERKIRNGNTIEHYTRTINELKSEIDPNFHFQLKLSDFEELIKNEEYDSILSVYNFKGLGKLNK